MKQIILFQKNLRKPITQFGEFFKHIKFIQLHAQIQDSATYKNLPSFNQEIHRRKDGFIHQLRRILGIPNIWPVFTSRGDMLFSYGYLLITNKPYCVYIENGLALYGFDRKVAKHPIALALVSLLVCNKNLKHLIFMSETSKTSFLNSAHYSNRTRKIIQKKSIVCRPAIKTSSEGKIKNGQHIPRFLFVGLFYMKGGVELINAFRRIIQKYPSVRLTIVTAKHIIRPEDQKKISKTPGITFLDATLSEREMDEMYRTHDVFVLPTFRDSCPSVLSEALSFGMPLILNDQYATHEAVRDGCNGFLFPHHPMQDYLPRSYEMLSKNFNPEDFYKRLFRLQKEGGTKSVEDFLFTSMEKFILNPNLVEEFSNHSLELYRERFDPQKNANQMESLLLSCLYKK